jgi:hypothetical protein
MPTVTPIACTLGAEDRAARQAAARELGERALVAVHVSERGARLRFRGDHERVDALVAAERACCAFFEFATTRNGEHTELEIRTAAGGEPMLRALVAGIVSGWEQGLR